MTRGIKGFAKGIVTGMAVGAAVGMVGGNMIKSNKTMRRKANKTMKAVGCFVNNIQHMIK